jgi:hypothetical protein
LPLGQGDDERCAAARFALGRDAPVVALCDFATDGKPDPPPLERTYAVQALKHGEDGEDAVMAQSSPILRKFLDPQPTAENRQTPSLMSFARFSL